MSGPPPGDEHLSPGDFADPDPDAAFDLDRRSRRRRRAGLPAGEADDGTVGSWISIVMVATAALTVIGLVALWPRGEAPDLGAQPRTYVDASITASRAGRCPGIEIPEQLEDCTIFDVRLASGANAGDTIELPVRPTQTEVPDLAEGDDIVLLYVPTSPEGFQYSFVDFQRSSPMVWLGVAFVVVVVAFGRLQGLRALAGLGMSLAILVFFVVPALLRDSPAVLVALVGAVAVAYLAIYLAHGVTITSSIALAGTLVSLAATCILAVVVASLTQLSGLASQEAQVLRVTAEALDLRGLLIAGIVVGALGVVDDVTVSQVSTVAALRRANPSFGPRELYAEATRVGRDHVASAVNTLVLAYAGASLPLLLFFAQRDQPFGRLITGELVAVEVVRMLVGSIGLVLSVPVTTRLAALVLTRRSPLPDDGHGHGHAHGLVTGDIEQDDLAVDDGRGGPWYGDEPGPFGASDEYPEPRRPSSPRPPTRPTRPARPGGGTPDPWF